MSRNDISVPLLHSFNQLYRIGFVALMRALERVRRPNVTFEIFAIYDVPDLASLIWVKQRVPQEGFDYHWINAGDLGLGRGMHVECYFSSACYFRLYAGSLLPERIERVVYLDVDVVMRECPSRLLSMDLGSSMVGAVVDFTVANRMRDLEPENDGDAMHEEDLRYFNSGVLVIDLKRWRAEGIEQRVLGYAARHKLMLPDQDALNVIFRGEWRALPLRWNVQLHAVWPGLRIARGCLRASELIRALLAPAALHFTSQTKPWHPNYRGLYTYEFLTLTTREERKLFGTIPWDDAPDSQFDVEARRVADERNERITIRAAITDAVLLCLFFGLRKLAFLSSKLRGRVSLRAQRGEDAPISAPRAASKTT